MNLVKKIDCLIKWLARNYLWGNDVNNQIQMRNNDPNYLSVYNNFARNWHMSKMMYVKRLFKAVFSLMLVEEYSKGRVILIWIYNFIFAYGKGWLMTHIQIC